MLAKCSHRTGGLESATSGAVERARSGVRSTERVETVESEWGDGRGTQRCRRRKLQATTPGRTASDSSHRRRRGGRIGLVETFAFQSLALATALTGCAPRRPLPLSRRNSRPSPARPARTELAWLAGSGEFLELERVFGTRPPQQSPGNRGFCVSRQAMPVTGAIWSAWTRTFWLGRRLRVSTEKRLANSRGRETARFTMTQLD